MMQCHWLQRRLHSLEYRKRQSAKKAIRDIRLGGLIHIKSGSGIGTLRRQMPYMDAGERLRFWRLRAEELRATASQFKDQIGKKGLWDAAEYYDRLADPTKSLTRTHRQRSGCNDVSFAQATPQVARPNTADRPRRSGDAGYALHAIREFCPKADSQRPAFCGKSSEGDRWE